jgi:hypothetical protein
VKTFAIHTKPENIILASAQYCKQIAAYLEDASKFDDKSVIYLKQGNYEKAAECAILAQELIRLASDVKIEDIRLHAAYN